jgi:hypothetical protein
MVFSLIVAFPFVESNPARPLPRDTVTGLSLWNGRPPVVDLPAPVYLAKLTQLAQHSQNDRPPEE